MSKRILCKFFVHGACLKGEHCEFSHDWTDQPNNICTFYQKGICSYGSRCRYDHVKVSRHPTSASSSSNSQLRDSADAVEGHSFVVAPCELTPPSSISPSSGYLSQLSASSRLFVPLARPVWDQDISNKSQAENLMSQDANTVRPSDIPICSFAAAGNCPRGDSCPHMHGDLCSICGKHCLHPFRPEEREEHIRLCLKNRNHLEALKCSQEIECCVCLDRVLSKTKPSERKFGLLSECDHPFCISCIRNWRSNSPDSGLDVNSALRACPICRKLSYFVIPSVIWYSSQEEKQEIVDSYKAKLRSIDCRHFDFGDGRCPFGTSCFYKHVFRDGRLEEVVLRHLDSEEGNTIIAKDIRLSDFLGMLRL